MIEETDHSPLEQILKKNIVEAPARLQRLLLRCMKFDITVRYKARKSIPVADTLSRVCFNTGADVHNAEVDLNNAGADLNKAGADVNKEIHYITTKSCPIDINSIQKATIQDQDLNKLKDVIFKGWPEYRKQCPQELWEYWRFRCVLVIEDGCILKGDRIIIPKTLRS